MSWYPPAYSDGQIQSNPGFSDSTLTSLLDIAHEHGIKGAAVPHVPPQQPQYVIADMRVFVCGAACCSCACACACARKVNLHIEPYKDRSEKSVAGDIRYVIGTCVCHRLSFPAPMKVHNVVIFRQVRRASGLLSAPQDQASHVRRQRVTTFHAMRSPLTAGSLPGFTCTTATSRNTGSGPRYMRACNNARILRSPI